MKDKLLYCHFQQDHPQKIFLQYPSGTKQVDLSFNDWIQLELLKDLTTLEGRKKAIFLRYGYYKNIPLFINENICLFLVPLSTQIFYFNAFMIEELKKQRNLNTSIIKFKDGTEIVLPKPIRYLKSQYVRSQSIQKVQNENVY